jgi:hypothetical protein
VITGAATDALSGKKLDVFGAFSSRRLGTTTVKSDGTFTARVALPAKKLRSGDKARYYVRSASDKSAQLKLSRRVTASQPTVHGKTVRINGRVSAPRASKQQNVSIMRRAGCSKWQTVKTVKLSASGRYTASIKVPSTGGVLVLRAKTKVPAKKGSKKLSASYSLPSYLKVD